MEQSGPTLLSIISVHAWSSGLCELVGHLKHTHWLLGDVVILCPLLSAGEWQLSQLMCTVKYYTSKSHILSHMWLSHAMHAALTFSFKSTLWNVLLLLALLAVNPTYTRTQTHRHTHTHTHTHTHMHTHTHTHARAQEVNHTRIIPPTQQCREITFNTDNEGPSKLEQGLVKH